MPLKVNLDNVAIVLSRPKFPGNVGAVARCAKNMGIRRVIVVGNRDMPMEEIRQMATHIVDDVVRGIQYHDHLDAALAVFQYVVGTTGRKGAARGPFVTPRRIARQLIDISQNNTVALLFGPEDSGLTNSDLSLCHAVVTIPTAGFKSLNLSHAVMVMCYEMFITGGGPLEAFHPRLASSKELEGMYDQLQDLLSKIGFLNPQNPEYWMLHIRRLLSRTTLQSREVKIIRGICRQIEWYASQRSSGEENNS
ncbi:MAG: RNA methyltransferase [Syntrophales bacterium]